MKTVKFLAKLQLFIRNSISNDWVDVATFGLDQPVIRIGRSKHCEIPLNYPEFASVCRATSRVHCSLYYYGVDSLDYWIQDGYPVEATVEEPEPKIILSTLGVYINSKQHHLEEEEKYELKNNDEFHLVYDRLKFVYYRDVKSTFEKLVEDTYIPEEYLKL